MMKVSYFDEISEKIRVGLLLILLPLTVLVNTAQSAGSYELNWSTIDGGGGTSWGGDFTLKATIGQPDAGFMSGGDYEMLGGFLPGVPVCIVDFAHFARFAGYWLEADCNDLNNWCGGADLNHLDNVDLVDLGLFADEWLNCCPVDWPLK